MKISVVALGKVGLPVAVQFACKGHNVVGIDVDSRVVSAVNGGREPFPGERDLAQKLAQTVETGRLRATREYGDGIPGSDAIVVVVPLFVDMMGIPDFGWLDAATHSIAEHLTPGALICYETTLPVGTTRTRWKPMLEDLSGLQEGVDFDLAFSPERVLTGRVFTDLRRYPKLVGALSPVGAIRVADFYRAVLDFDERPDLPRPNGVWDLGSAEAAELAKLAETTYRDVNIGLANQFARFAGKQGIDIHQVFEAANSQPYSNLHKPGIAVGGHCIPVYPRLYLWKDPDATIIRTAREANEDMPTYAVGLLAGMHGQLEGAEVAVLGASYRGGVKETAFSGVFPTVQALQAAGATVRVHDPLFDDDELTALGLRPYHLGERVDAVVIQADHDQYRRLQPCDVPGATSIVDGRSVTEAKAWQGVRRCVIGG